MVLELTQEQLDIQKKVRCFAEQEIAPIASVIDKTHCFPVNTVKRMAELGLFSLSIPTEYEGKGKDNLSLILAVEELAKVCATHAVILSTHTLLCVHPILRFGNQQQKEKYLPNLVQGKNLGAFCLTEPNAGTDASAQQTEAVFDGKNYILNGKKIFITNATVADIFMVMAMTDKQAGLKGISAFIVDKNFPGISIDNVIDKMGICGSSTAEVTFNHCIVPKENLLGEEGQGFKIAMKTLDGGRIGIAAQALGIAQGALNAAITYSKERKQFNKPICANQGIQWYLADMATKVEATRLLVYQASQLKNMEANYTKEAAMAKLYASTTAMEVTTKALQIHGGIGYTKYYPVERYMRDAKITEIYEGTSEVMKMVIANQILA